MYKSSMKPPRAIKRYGNERYRITPWTQWIDDNYQISKYEKMKKQERISKEGIIVYRSLNDVRKKFRNLLVNRAAAKIIKKFQGRLNPIPVTSRLLRFSNTKLFFVANYFLSPIVFSDLVS